MPQSGEGCSVYSVLEAVRLSARSHLSLLSNPHKANETSPQTKLNRTEQSRLQGMGQGKINEIMDLALSPFTAKAFLSRPGQVLTSLDLIVIKWKTEGHIQNHLLGPLQLTEDLLSGCYRCVVFSL